MLQEIYLLFYMKTWKSAKITILRGFKTRITRNKTRNSVSLVLCAPRLRPLSETDPGVSIQYSFNIHSCHAKVVLLTGLLTGTWLR